MLIEQTIREYLLEKIPNVPVDVKVPTDTNKCIVFRIIDRGKEDYINAVTVEFYSYGESLLEASQLDEKLRDAMENIIVLDSIFASKLGGGSEDYDTDLDRYRYRAYFNLFY